MRYSPVGGLENPSDSFSTRGRAYCPCRVIIRRVAHRTERCLPSEYFAVRWFLPFLLALFFTLDSSAAEEIRVLIGQAAPQVLIAGQELQVTDRAGRSARFRGRIFIQASGAERFILNRSSNIVPGPLKITTSRPTLTCNEKAFPGSLELQAGTAGHIQIINVVGLEDYLCGVINGEIASGWPLEAIKAQVVAARTYALRKKMDSDGIYDVQATTVDQVYKDGVRQDARAVRAVRETEGLVITYQGKPIIAYYHSCCGGHTDSAANIKGKDLPYVIGVPCTWCRGCPKSNWRLELSSKRVAERLASRGYSLKSVERILPVRTTVAGRIVDLEIIGPDKSVFLTGEDLREALGHMDLRSARFRVVGKHKAFVFLGEGYGHGIGACQWGMKGMAEQGYTWQQILKHYYRGVELGKIR